MGMNETPSGERIHIGFFGRRNAGKSSLVNAVTGQDLAVVSDVRGTTTDPVTKAMELLPMGPVVIIDTPGFDDEGSLGELRIRKTRQVLNRTDVAVLVADSTEELKPCDKELLELFRKKEIPYLIAWNKCDLLDENYKIYSRLLPDGSFMVKLMCVNPSVCLRECLGKGVGTVFFSATLLPIRYYKELLSGSQEEYAVYAKSPF